MSKNIVICCDGTNNQLEGDLTNVVRIFQVALQNAEQAAFYDPGVGTMASPEATGPISSRWSMFKGLAFGAGFQENVFEAYRYLMRTYQEGDRIFLFGFSRGAFTVRTLAGMLHGVGLLTPGSENLLPYLWRHYLGIRILPKGATQSQIDAAKKYDASTEVLRASFTRPCPVAFLGPWDTVGSVGMYNANQAFPFTYENPSVAVVRHAVSLDERRCGFRSNVFKSDDTPLPGTGRPRVMNVWFPGVHSDIGGGYPWPESGLAMISYQWMVREARAFGLLVDEARLSGLLAGCRPDPAAQIHESLTGAWKALEYVPARRYNWKTAKTEWRRQPNKPRTLAVAEVFLHRSILDRLQAKPEYRPPNLPAGDLAAQFKIED
ncbi:DUF2235 domain-containing protein [Prosthecobacter fluviatilis]|uniref:DUF2235 domain-containing protein n=1 Tax=Prosthecobacter fluviatilis TaxID=445931 RepID=A0ABW0KW22_9BACT